MKFQTLVLSGIVAIFSFTSCGDSTHEDHGHDIQTETNLSAITVHEESIKLAKEFHARLAGEFAQTPTTDSTFIKLVSLDARYVIWNKSMVKLPGMACNHEEGEHHVHDHAAEDKLAQLSAEDLLTLQEAIQDELKSLILDLDSLIEDK
ncbi:MAG: hypothetical protein ACKVJ6_03000 [Flavobacteriales bacterium]|jgi:hypothetical protein